MRLKKFKKPSKKVTIGIVAGAVVLVGGIVAFNATRDTTNYYSVWKAVMSNDVGSFRFVLDVRTSPTGEKKVELSESQDLTQRETENIEADDKDAVEADKEKQKAEPEESKDENSISDQTDTKEEGKTWDELVNNKGNVSDTWSSATGSNLNTWDYPNYQVVIEGCTTKAEPLTSSFDISISTEDFSDKLTTVTVVDDVAYVNLEQLKYWLTNSKDSYFIELANELPENSKNMEIPLDDVQIPLAFSEDGEDIYETNIMNAYHRFAKVFGASVSTIESSMGSKGLSKQDDKFSIDLSGGNANTLVNTVKSIASNRASIYDQMINVEQGAGYLTDKQYKQLAKGKDNFLAATDEFYRSTITKDLSNTNLKVTGTARKYQGGTGIINLEAEVLANFTLGKTDYTIGFSGTRTGQSMDIKAPDGSKTDYTQKELFDVAGDIIDHLNITNIDFGKQLEVTPDTIKDDLIDDFVKLVNSTDSTSAKITNKTAIAFIEKYKDYEETSETTPDDIINAQLVYDFLESVEEVLPDEVLAKNESTDEVEKFRVVNNKIGDVSLIAQFNETESSSKLGVIDVTLTNPTDKAVTVNLEDFSLQTMLSSKYPCNDYTTIRDYNNKFDKSKLKGEVEVQANGYTTEKLYVVMQNGTEYMELFYDDDKMGDIIVR